MAIQNEVESALPPNAIVGMQTRLALRGMAKSVTVLTCQYRDTRYAMAATAVDVISLDPPSMLVSVNQSASMHQPLLVAGIFAINILAKSQEAVARACGGERSGEARFEVGEWLTGLEGVPILAGAQATIVCRHVGSRTYGTHRLIIGDVVVALSDPAPVDPLVYLNGAYIGVAVDAPSGPGSPPHRQHVIAV